MRLDLHTSALPTAGLELLRDVLVEVYELAADGATRVEAASVSENGFPLRAVITSDKLEEPKVISLKDGE